MMIWVFTHQLPNPLKDQILTCSFLLKGQLNLAFIPHGVQTFQISKEVDSIGQVTDKQTILNSLLSLIFFFLILIPRARIETRRSSTSDDQRLECRQGVCGETVSNPYTFDDYDLHTMGVSLPVPVPVHRGIKPGNGGFIREHKQGHQSTTFPDLPHDHHLYNLNSFKYSLQESDFLKVNHYNLIFLLSIILVLVPSQSFKFNRYMDSFPHKSSYQGIPVRVF